MVIKEKQEKTYPNWGIEGGKMFAFSCPAANFDILIDDTIYKHRSKFSEKVIIFFLFVYYSPSDENYIRSLSHKPSNYQKSRFK